jgi:hypothetical protein
MVVCSYGTLEPLDGRVAEGHRLVEGADLLLERRRQPGVDRRPVEGVVGDRVVARRMQIRLTGALASPLGLGDVGLLGQATGHRRPRVVVRAVVAILDGVGDRDHLADIGRAVRSETKRPGGELLV